VLCVPLYCVSWSSSDARFLLSHIDRLHASCPTTPTPNLNSTSSLAAIVFSFNSSFFVAGHPWLSLTLLSRFIVSDWNSLFPAICTHSRPLSGQKLIEVLSHPSLSLHLHDTTYPVLCGHPSRFYVSLFFHPLPDPVLAFHIASPDLPLIQCFPQATYAYGSSSARLKAPYCDAQACVYPPPKG